METYSVTCWPPEVYLAELIIQTQTSYNYYTTYTALILSNKISKGWEWDICIRTYFKND